MTASAFILNLRCQGLDVAFKLFQTTDMGLRPAIIAGTSIDG